MGDRIITLRNGTRVNMSTGEIISQGRPRYPHRPRRSFWRRVGDGFSRFFGFVWSVLAFILSAVVFIWYIILYGGLLSIIVTVISVWISDGFFSALIAGVVSFFVWGLVVGVADKLGMLPD